jgi:hypothetical protein
VLENSDGSAAAMLDFSRAVRAPFEDETPEIYEAAEIAGLWGADRIGPQLLRREELGILRSLPEDRVEVISPACSKRRSSWRSATSAARPRWRRPSSSASTPTVARAFVDLFVKEIWEPFDRAGRPEEDWPRIREALDRMRPLASRSVVAVFQIAMDDAAEKASERTLR